MNALSLLVAGIAMPLIGAVACQLRPRGAQAIGLSLSLGWLLMLLIWICFDGRMFASAIGPLVLRLDGFALLMLLMNALVGAGVGLYAAAYFEPAERARFWPLWLLLLAALNALYPATHLIHLYLALELAGVVAAALAAMAAGSAAPQAALRYLFASAVGSLTLLMGAALLFSAHGSLALDTLAHPVPADAVTAAGCALLIGGLLVKSALVPLHFWLPDFHSAAPAPVSALHAALVLKAAVFVCLVLMRDLFVWIDGFKAVGWLLGGLGATAIIWGSIHALHAQRLKRVIAYSTVAQVGYLFVGLALIERAGTDLTVRAMAFFMLAHALAKAAMFLAAGAVHRALGHDRIAEMHGIGNCLPLPVLTLAIAGASIIGLPPTGGFVAKWLLLEAALVQPMAFPWVAILLLGSLLSAAYVFRVLHYAFATEQSVQLLTQPSRGLHAMPLLLATMALVLGMAAPWPLALLASALA